MPRDYVGPVRISLPETYLELLQLEGGFSIFQIKDETKKFTTELFPAPRSLVSYTVTSVAERSTPIGLHGTP